MKKKKCKYCKTEIDPKAKICPNCKMVQKNYIVIYVFLCVFIFICIFGSIILNTSNNIENNSANQKSELITLEEFNKIESDMTYEQVKEIIGSDGTLTSDVSIGDEKYHTQIYMWYGNTITGGNANVTFQNGKVVGKAQVGLK